MQAAFESWVDGLWFRPNALKDVKRFQALGVYVPFWTFDCRVHSDWSADAGHYYYVTQMVPVMVKGKLRLQRKRVRKVRWVPAWGERDDAFDDQLIHASLGLDAGLVAKLGGFDTAGLVPYRAEYLAGWHAEEYQVDLAEGWQQAEAAVIAVQRDRCAGDVPGDTQRNLRVRNRISDVRWKHVLLPVWSLQYRYGARVYTVLVKRPDRPHRGQGALQLGQDRLRRRDRALRRGAAAPVDRPLARPAAPRVPRPRFRRTRGAAARYDPSMKAIHAMLCAALAAPLGATPDHEADEDSLPRILSARERATLRDAWLEERLDRVVPALMRREGIDMWILIAREYNEDPVLETMLPATWLAARRRTILVFSDGGEEAGVERFAVARYTVGPFPRAWDKEEQPDQWHRLAELVAERDPERIGVNRSSTFALADGLTATEEAQLLAALEPEYRERLTSAEALCIGWLETRTDAEMAVYPDIMRIAHAIIAEGLSNAVITPGETTTKDVEWWFRERVLELRLSTWFHPTVSVQSAGGDERSGSFASKPGEMVIQRGDLVHVDFGITYLGLNTDTQQHAYVLREDEAAPPAELVRALAVGNRLQDILTDAFVAGRSGNQILAAALAQAADEGIEATIYTHPLGFHGHGAGPTIGLWDQQGGVPGRGDYPLYANTVHSIELNAQVAIEAWGGEKIRVMLEEDAFFDGKAVSYLNGRQTELLLIR